MGDVAGGIMGGAGQLMGGNSNSNGTTNSSVSSGNLAYPAVSNALSPTMGNVSQGSSYLSSLLGIPTAPTPVSAAPAPTPAFTGGIGGGRGGLAGMNGSSMGSEPPSISMMNDGIPGNYQAAMAAYQRNGSMRTPATAPVPTPAPVAATPVAPMSQTGALQNFADSAGMKFLSDNENRAIDNNQAAKGLLQSGSTLKGISDYNKGLNSQYLNQYLNNVLQYTNLGNQAAGTISDAGKYMSSNSRGSTSSSSKQGLGI